MTVNITLPDWNTQTWIWVLVGFYLLNMYAVFGPLLGRWVYRNEKSDPDFAAFMVWLFSPVVVPLVAVVVALRFSYLKTVGRVIYGGKPPEAKS